MLNTRCTIEQCFSCYFNEENQCLACNEGYYYNKNKNKCLNILEEEEFEEEFEEEDEKKNEEEFEEEVGKKNEEEFEEEVGKKNEEEFEEKVEEE